MSLKIDADSFDPSSLEDINNLINFIVPQFLIKPGVNTQRMDEIETFKKALIHKFFAKSVGKSRVQSLKDLIAKAPKEKRQALFYVLVMMGVWDGIENSELTDEEEVDVMSTSEIIETIEWAGSGEIEGFDDETLNTHIQTAGAIAVSIASHAVRGEEVLDVCGEVIYQDKDFIIVNTDSGELVALARTKLDDISVYSGSIIYAQMELDGDMKGYFKLLPPGITLER